MSMLRLEEIAKRETFTREEIKTILECAYNASNVGKEIARIIFPKEAQGFARGLVAGVVQVQEMFGFVTHSEAKEKFL